MKTIEIRVYDINHAGDIIYYDNLIVKFEEVFGEIEEGSNLVKHIKNNNITLDQLIEFLNKYTEKDERYLLA